MPSIAVIGLGRFGMELAKQLGECGVDVIAIDRSKNLVDDIKDHVSVAVKLDSTDETALRSQNIDNVDVCVVAIGENFEAALLTTVIVKKMDVPRVICRAQTQFHADIFKRIGASEVIQPEQQTGKNLARKLANPQIQDFIQLAEGFTLIELQAPVAFQNKSLEELQLRVTYFVNLVAIKRLVPVPGDEGEEKTREIVSVPKSDDVIQPNDVLVLVGSDEALARMPRE